MDNENKHTHWIVITLIQIITALVIFAAITIYIDPLFHYHLPLDSFAYPIFDERYQNDGIIRNFKYDSIIIGTSMTENFKTSEANKLFDANFIKVPFSGGRYKEINENLERAFDTGKDIKYVIRCLDYSMLVTDKDAYREGTDYPVYLYNDDWFDDVNYVLNKSIFFDYTWNVVKNTKEGNTTTSFDIYANWNAFRDFGKEAVLNVYTLDESAEAPQVLKEEERKMVLENIQQNVTDLADKYPETNFYLFFPPYSICYWDAVNNRGQVDWRIDAEQIAIEEILKHTNIKLYSFCNDFEMVCNLDNYSDQAHYGEWVNTWILEWIYNDQGLLTSDNYQEYLDTIREFYNSYDYSTLRE